MRTFVITGKHFIRMLTARLLADRTPWYPRFHVRGVGTNPLDISTPSKGSGTRGTHPWKGHGTRDTHPLPPLWTEWLTNTYKNITFPWLCLWEVTIGTLVHSIWSMFFRNLSAGKLFAYDKDKVNGGNDNVNINVTQLMTEQSVVCDDCLGIKIWNRLIGFSSFWLGVKITFFSPFS